MEMLLQERKVFPYGWFFYCFDFRRIDEYPGGIQYPGHKGFQYLGSQCICTVYRTFGAIGAFITYTVIKSMDSLGPARAVMLIVVAQLLVAYLIELFGLFGAEKQPWEWRKAIGMAVAVAGIVIFKWK